MTAELFVNSKEKANVIHTVTAQTFCGKNLCRDDPFRITRSTAVDELIVLTRSDERRHCVHMRREHNTRRLFGSGKHIEPLWTDLLFLNAISEPPEIIRKILA